MFHLPALLIALVLSGWAEAREIDGRSGQCWLAPLLLLLFALLPRLLAPLLIGRGGSWRLWLWRRLLGLLALAGHAAVVTFGDWSGCLAFLGLTGSGLEGWPRPGALLQLGPYALLAWVSLDAQARFSGLSRPAWQALRRFQVRQLAVGLLALGLAVLLCWPLWLHRPLRVWVEESAPAATAFTLALALCFAALFPLLLQFGLRLRPLPASPLRQAFTDLIARSGFRRVTLRIWPTDGWLANAAIIGLLPGLRLVMLTDGILRSLGRSELLAVLAHELGHARRRHVLLYTVFSLGWLGLWPGLVSLWVRPGQVAFELGSFALLLVTWLLAFGTLSRRAELDADLFALELIGNEGPLLEALRAVSGPGGSRRGSWRHFSSAKRGLFLRAAAADPGVGQRLRAGLSLWSRAAALLLLISLGLSLAAWRRSAAQERLRIDLRLGAYSEAAARASLVEADAPQLAASARLGPELAAHLPPDPGAWLAAARAELLAGQPDRAVTLLDLGWLRDLPGLEPARRALGAPISAGDSAPAWSWPDDALAPLQEQP